MSTSAPDNVFFVLRSRAYELADTGRYNEWGQIAYALLGEGFPPATITRFHNDVGAVMLVTRACRMKNARALTASARIRKWFRSLLLRTS